MFQLNQLKFFRWTSRELVLRGQITLGEGGTRLTLPSNVGDILLFFFIVPRGGFFFNFIFLVSIIFCLSSFPSIFISNHFFPFFGWRTIQFSHLVFFFIFLFLPFPCLFSFFFNKYFECWWRIWRRHGNVFFHCGNKKTCTFFQDSFIQFVVSFHF